MGKKFDLLGKRFGHLDVVSLVPVVNGERRKRGVQQHWLCRCDCGTFVSVDTQALTRFGRATCERATCPYYEEERFEAREHDRVVKRRWRQTQKEKAAEQQDAPVEHMADISTPKASRACHDCGKPCTDYRCPKCRDKWRKKNNVSSGDVYVWDANC